MKIQYKTIYKRTRDLIIAPSESWRSILKEQTSQQQLINNYLLPLTIACSLLVFPISLFNYSVLQSIGLSFINLLASVIGTWIAYLLVKEYLCNKLDFRPAQALKLTIYSAAVFILFHSIGAALGNLFIGQLFTLASFIFIRTLYIGINTLPDIPANQKTNTIIIATLAIICCPIIVAQILMIMFRISAINI